MADASRSLLPANSMDILKVQTEKMYFSPSDALLALEVVFLKNPQGSKVATGETITRES